MLAREAEVTLLLKASYYPIIAIIGPRQAGKSTLAKKLFPQKPYCSLEDWDNRQFATDDPRRFLAQFHQGAILDEVQHCPALFSYLQTLVDQQQEKGLFILTGSQQFSLMANLTQSLAGRVGLIQLLPFTLTELQQGQYAPAEIEPLLFNGCYPPIYDKKIPSPYWMSDYVMTYLERDVRQLIHIQDLRVFHRFLQMCAVRTGQLLNLSNLASDCGITHNTAKAWLSVLEASYLVFLLSPHHRNFNKRLVKTSKIYFYDTGLACFLAGIQSSEQLIAHPMRGSLFETWVVSELIKRRFNQGVMSDLYFWRDRQGHEVDVLIEQGAQLIPVEIKSGKTIASDYFDSLEYWSTLSQQSQITSWLIYAGNVSQERSKAKVLSWSDIAQLDLALKNNGDKSSS
ncbi:MAG: ATP-binding protein [Gammaproteobacteria bacterium]|nr:ATP-binding protein [Gammaproteobacteria bacterium]